MKSFEQIAQAAYAAFTKQAERTDVDGLVIGPLLDWEDMHEIERQCWVEATKQIAAELALVH